MSKLKSVRELQNLTQEELSEKSGVSTRTIQRIESGKEAKGYTLRVLAKALEVEEANLLYKGSKQEKSGIVQEREESKEAGMINYSYLKLSRIKRSIKYQVSSIKIWGQYLEIWYSEFNQP